jgi:non-specific serine/threonine protein kinase
VTTAAELAPGSVLAGFRIEALAGRGGMGVVYRATQLSLKRAVALKLISPELAAEERFRERFLREAQLAASLDHPHVLPVYEAGEEAGTLFLAMRLVEGASLADVLRRESRLAPERALRLCMQLAQALEAAHEAGLLHRDVKPGNVLLTGAGDSEHAYLCDFGLARRLAEAGMSQERAFLGTAAYAAPEQIRGEPLDERADLYALACLLYECLCGQPPFAAEDELALCWAQLHESLPAPGSLDPALSCFDHFFARALAKVPAERFSSAAELAATARAAPAASEAPPAPPHPAPRLPRPLTPFLGRERELGELLELLLSEDVRLLTLSGPGGTGKTRLALRAAEEAAPAFADGVYWVALASLRDPALIGATIAQALGVKGEVAEAIGEKRLLLVLDNLEQVIAAAPELSALLSECPNLRLLVTSRELLRVHGELDYAVPPLAEPEAITFFCANSRLEPSAEIAELCARLDNLPLALELAATRTRALSPTQILERVSQRLDLLKGGRDADPRQQTLRATIGWSYDLLSSDEQKLFARLAVFTGGCTLEAAEEICGADVETLATLVDKSLVRPGESPDQVPRFWMLETIREFAAEQLVPGDEAKTRSRHADHFARTVEQAAGHLRKREERTWLDRLETEHANIRAALDWLIRTDLPTAARVTSCLRHFWYIRGHFEEGRTRAESIIVAPGAEDIDRATMRSVLQCAGSLSYAGGDYGAARGFMERALAMADGVDDLAMAVDLGSLGLLTVNLGDAKAGEALHRDALELLNPVDHAADIANATNNLGYALLVQGDLPGAEVHFTEALGGFRSLGDSEGIAVATFNLGLVALGFGRLAEARSNIRESLETAHELGLAQGVALCLIALAAMTDQEPDRAANFIGAADMIVDGVGLALDPYERRLRDETWRAIETALGPSAAEAAAADGQRLSADDAVILAVSALGLPATADETVREAPPA